MKTNAIMQQCKRALAVSCLALLMIGAPIIVEAGLGTGSQVLVERSRAIVAQSPAPGAQRAAYLVGSQPIRFAVPQTAAKPAVTVGSTGCVKDPISGTEICH